MPRVPDSATHSGTAPRDLLWVLQKDEGTVTAEEYRRRLKEAKKERGDS